MNFDISSSLWVVFLLVLIGGFIGLVWWATTHGVDYKSAPKNEREKHEFFDDYPN